MPIYIVSTDSKYGHLVYTTDCISKIEIQELGEELGVQFEAYELINTNEIIDLPVIKTPKGIYLNEHSLLKFANGIVCFFGPGVSVHEIETPETAKTHILVCEGPNGIFVAKHTQSAIDFIKPLCKQINSILLPTQSIDTWFDLYKKYPFESFDQAFELVNKLDQICKSLPTVKKLQEDIFIIKNYTNIPITENPTWKMLKFNMAEYAVCEALLKNSDELWKLKTVQLIVLRWFLYERVSTETRSSQITVEFNTWLAQVGIQQTVAEIGTILRLLGYTSRRVSSGIRWDLSDKNKLIDVSMLRETDVFTGTASLFKIL